MKSQRTLEGYPSHRQGEGSSLLSDLFPNEAGYDNEDGVVVNGTIGDIDTQWAQVNNDPRKEWPELKAIKQEREQKRERLGSRLRKFGHSVINYFRSSPEVPRHQGLDTPIAAEAPLGSFNEQAVGRGVIGVDKLTPHQSPESSYLRQEAYAGVIGEPIPSLLQDREKTHATIARQAREGGIIGASSRYTIPQGRHEASFRDEIDNNGVIGA